MNELVTLSSSGSLTMSSLEISTLVEKRHDNVKRTIETLVEQGVIVRPQFEGEPGTDAIGRSRITQIYRFSGERGKRDSIIVVAQLCPEFTARLVDRWQELESKVSQPAIPQSLPEALRLAADLAEQKAAVEREKLVRSYQSDLEEFGRVRFEIAPFETAGGTQQREVAILNEQQSTLLLTYMRNSEIELAFRFFKAKRCVSSKRH